MKGYVAKKGTRWYAVIYEGIDPVTGKERRSWHAAGTDRTDAERLAARLASDLEGRNDQVRSFTLGAFLTSRWLPGKRVVLAATTYNGYRRNVENHVVPALGRIGLRRLRPHHLERFYDRLLHPSDGRSPLAPKTVYEIHLVIRGALDDAVRRGLLTRNVVFTIDTYQHVLPGMQADAARVFEQLVVPGLPPVARTSENVKPRYPRDTSAPVPGRR